MSPFWRSLKLVEEMLCGDASVVQWKKATATLGFAHLLQIKGKGVGLCPNVTYQMLCAMRKEVERCKDLVERGKKQVSLPVPPSEANSSKNKRGPLSEIEKSWAY
jgi:hypothetical protein